MNFKLLQRHCEERSNLLQYDYIIETASFLAVTNVLQLQLIINFN